MRDIVVKIDKKDKLYVDLDVYSRTSKRGFNLYTVTARFLGTDQAPSLKTWEKIHPGFMCLACGKPELSDVANGHILVEKPDLGLCGSCASTQEIFERFVTSDATGEYKLKSRA